MWGAIIGRPALLITAAALLLAGDHRAWPVNPELQPLWVRLRLATLLTHVARIAAARLPGAQPPAAARVASHICTTAAVPCSTTSRAFWPSSNATCRAA